MTDLVTVGDPEAMRATARALLAQADGIALAPETAVAGLDALVLEGPAADRLLSASEEVRRQAQQAAADIEDVAAALQADAARVEQMNEELRLAAVQAAAQAAAAAAASAAAAAADAAKALTPQPAPGDPAAPAAPAPAPEAADPSAARAATPTPAQPPA
jgi:hypothetical protein